MIEPRIQIGTVGFPVSKKLVFADVDLVELTECRGVPPKSSTGKRWRSEAPGRVSFSVQLPEYLHEAPPPGTLLTGDIDGYGLFKSTKENLDLWDKAIRFAKGVEASALVLPTSAGFTPDMSNRKALSGFLKAVDTQGFDIVWEPHGPWETEQAAAFAREQGMVLAVDPLRDPVPEGDFAYFRLGPFAAMGSQMGIYDLERIGEELGRFERAVCVFQTARALDDVRNLKKIL